MFDTADCNFTNSDLLSEAVLALHIDNGNLAWVYRPHLGNLACDWDFGASVNAGITAQGVATFVGAGGKDGTYYSLNPVTGRLRWATNVVFGGFSGGFIATTAYDGRRVYGTIALGDFGRFEKDVQVLCDPSNPRDTAHAAADGEHLRRGERRNRLAGRRPSLLCSHHRRRGHDLQRAGERERRRGA